MDLNRALLEYQPLSHKLTSKFRVWHVEALLNQAADLLEKCLEEEKEYKSLVFSWTQFQLDLQAELDIIALEEKKRDQGYFLRDKSTIESENKFLSNSQKDFNDSKIAARGAYDNSDSNTSGEKLVPYQRASQTLVEKNIEAIEREIRTEVLKDRLGWADQDVKNSKDQIVYKRALHDYKEKFKKDGGPFDLSKRIEAVEKRLKRNYEDAYDRLSVAKQGLELIYGYEQISFPDKAENLITDLVVWNREAIEWLVAYQQREQGFTRVVSVSTLLKEKWKGLEDFKTRLPLHIPSDLFRSHTNVRLRGIGASMVGGAGLIPWAVSIGVPKQAVFYRSKNNPPEPINQSEMPLCLLGRVENRKSPHPVEICGLISIINASPIGYSVDDLDPEGNWSIKIEPPISTSEKFSEIDDILLEISVVGLP